MIFLFKITECRKNTSYLACFSNVGIYDCGDGTAVLIDAADHKKSVADLDSELTKRNLSVRTVLLTHGHLDHTLGNVFLQDKYGCDIYASEGEIAFAHNPNLEGNIIFNAIPVRRFDNGNVSRLGADIKLLTKEVLPDGFETVSLPGHSHDMIGIKTPDDVWFLGDALLMKETYDSYKIPFFQKINESIETLNMLPSLKGKLFVPSHCPMSDDITELASYNAQRLLELKEYFYTICHGKSFEQIMQRADSEMSLQLNCDKYAKIGVTVKAFLQSLMEDGKVTASIANGNLVYLRI